MKKVQAREDLQWIDKILSMTHRRVDPHLFHAIIWGAVVLFWYPLMNYFFIAHPHLVMPTMIFFITVGAITSFAYEIRTAIKPRMKAENTQLSRQIAAIAWIFVGFGTLLSILISTVYPNNYSALYFVWGSLYFLMLATWGVFYSREFLWCCPFPLLGVVFALLWPHYAGFILGPTMGMGILIPGIIAEKRVMKMRQEI